MSKEFNVDGLCIPKLHYMVNLDHRVNEIRTLVDKGKYFVINRARQYGKTTTLEALRNELCDEYMVFLVSFEGFTDDVFTDETTFCRRFFGLIYDAIHYGTVSGISDTIMDESLRMSQPESKAADLRTLSNFISLMCTEAKRPIVLMIDEVDQASNHAVFLAFLGMLRDMYLKRMNRPVFRSVILAGVYDIRNLKLKIRGEGEHQYNSPWNIAAEFDVDMSFSVSDISGMLAEYENDHRTGMDVTAMARMLYDYTSGYPYLVSRICKIIDEKIAGSEEHPGRGAAWTKSGFQEAVKILLSEKNPLFESLANKLTDFPELNEMIYSLLFEGRSIAYNPDNHAIDIAIMFGFVKAKDGMVVIANRIFETRLYNSFLSLSEVQNSDLYRASLQDKSQFIEDGRLNMSLVMQRFVTHFTDLYGDRGEAFLEEEGRRYFLLYLRPIINGAGNYYIEARTRDLRRTDVVVDYHGEQFIIEMKIWHGDEYNRRGVEQLAGYLEDYHQQKGYLLSFNFNKNKQGGIREIVVGDKLIVEAVV